MSFLKSEDAKDKKCGKLNALVSSRNAMPDLLLKLKFFKANSSAVLSIIMKIEAESTLVYEVYPMLGVCFCALVRSQWHSPAEMSFNADVSSLAR